MPSDGTFPSPLFFSTEPPIKLYFTVILSYVTLEPKWLAPFSLRCTLPPSCSLKTQPSNPKRPDPRTHTGTPFTFTQVPPTFPGEFPFASLLSQEGGGEYHTS